MVSPTSAPSTRRAPATRNKSSQVILVVEDEPAVREMVADNFRMAGYPVEEVGDVSTARRAISARMPSLILLDWMLPDASGLEFLRSLRKDEATRALPVIMLTARGDESDRVRGLDVGADDYIRKPFSFRELEARVRAVLRRAPEQFDEAVVEAGSLCMDTNKHQIRANGVVVDLGPTEFRLLHFLMSHPQRVFSRTQLLDKVWGEDAFIEERTVDVHIRRLRKNLEPHKVSDYVQTVRGVGYRFAVN